jgi:hypothetical protein
MTYAVEMTSDGMHMDTKFEDNLFRNVSNITDISLIIWEVIMLALLMRWIYDIHNWDGLTMIYTFHEDWYRRPSNIKVISQKSEKLQCWNYWWEGFTPLPSYDVIFLPIFMKFCTGFPGIFKNKRNLGLKCGWRVGLTTLPPSISRLSK